MPLFTYQCETCESRFEALVSFSEADKAVRCPDCQGDQTRRALSRVAAMPISSGSQHRSFTAPATSCAPGGT